MKKINIIIAGMLSCFCICQTLATDLKQTQLEQKSRIETPDNADKNTIETQEKPFSYLVPTKLIQQMSIAERKLHQLKLGKFNIFQDDARNLNFRETKALLKYQNLLIEYDTIKLEAMKSTFRKTSPTTLQNSTEILERQIAIRTRQIQLLKDNIEQYTIQKEIKALETKIHNMYCEIEHLRHMQIKYGYDDFDIEHIDGAPLERLIQLHKCAFRLLKINELKQRIARINNETYYQLLEKHKKLSKQLNKINFAIEKKKLRNKSSSKPNYRQLYPQTVIYKWVKKNI